jgi:hypothetical protein
MIDPRFGRELVFGTDTGKSDVDDGLLARWVIILFCFVGLIFVSICCIIMGMLLLLCLLLLVRRNGGGRVLLANIIIRRTTVTGSPRR